MSFIKVVSVFSMLLVLADAAKYEVTRGNLRLSKEEKIKAVKNFHERFDSLISKVSKKHDKAKKQIDNAKKLQTWNAYNDTYSTKIWAINMAYGSATCDGDLTWQYNGYVSYCYVGTFDTSEGKTYESAQVLANTDCTEETVVFYTSSDCSGTPSQQGNTAATGYSNDCVTATDIDDDGDDDSIDFSVKSAKSYCSSANPGWGGGDAIQQTYYEQSDTCSGTNIASYTWILGGCYEEGSGGSLQISSGPTYTYYDGCNDCSCTSSYSVSIDSGKCYDTDDDDDGDDDDDNLIDDGMFTSFEVNNETSLTYTWNASSMGAILNYSMSVVLVVMACSLLF